MRKCITNDESEEKQTFSFTFYCLEVYFGHPLKSKSISPELKAGQLKRFRMSIQKGLLGHMDYFEAKSAVNYKLVLAMCLFKD